MTGARRTDAADDNVAIRVLRQITDHTKGFERRDEQEAMCREIADCMKASGNLAVSAGTGIGKSLAYLVPAALHNEPVVVAAWTKNLQDQLFFNEVPRVAKAVKIVTGKTFGSAVLKGKENYCCRQRLLEVMGGADETSLSEDHAVGQPHLKILANWASTSKFGDLVELQGKVHEDLIEAVNGKECVCRRLLEEDPHAEQCFVLRARRRAEAAHLLIVNHHLYAIHLRARGRFLPEHQYVIIDEAHSFSTTVTDTAGSRLDEADLKHLLEVATRGNVPENTQKRLRADGEALARVLKQSANARVERPDSPTRRFPLWDSIQRLRATLADLASHLPVDTDNTVNYFALESTVTRISGCLEEVSNQRLPDGSGAIAFVTGEEDTRALRTAPIFPSRFVEGTLRNKTKVVLASATLDETVVDEFGSGRKWRKPFASESRIVLKLPSPFDYQKHSRMYIPAEMPHPSKAETEHWKAALLEMKELLPPIGGRTLVLFTSWRALLWTYEQLNQWSKGRGLTVLRQDDDRSPLELVQALTPHNPTVVCATMKFWQGVDVPGPGLQLVILHKLPFLPFDDPVYRARHEALEMAQLESFTVLQIPHVRRMLAQGIGRLIRTSNDRGVAAVLDDRYEDYSEDILTLTPGLPITRDQEKTIACLRKLRAG